MRFHSTWNLQLDTVKGAVVRVQGKGRSCTSICSRHLCIHAHRTRRGIVVNVQGWTECRKCRSNFLPIPGSCNAAMRPHNCAICGVAMFTQQVKVVIGVFIHNLTRLYVTSSGQLQNPGLSWNLQLDTVKGAVVRVQGKDPLLHIHVPATLVHSWTSHTTRNSC